MQAELLDEPPESRMVLKYTACKAPRRKCSTWQQEHVHVTGDDGRAHDSTIWSAHACIEVRRTDPPRWGPHGTTMFTRIARWLGLHPVLEQGQSRLFDKPAAAEALVNTSQQRHAASNQVASTTAEQTTPAHADIPQEGHKRDRASTKGVAHMFAHRVPTLPEWNICMRERFAS